MGCGEDIDVYGEEAEEGCELGHSLMEKFLDMKDNMEEYGVEAVGYILEDSMHVSYCSTDMQLPTWNDEISARITRVPTSRISLPPSKLR